MTAPARTGQAGTLTLAVSARQVQLAIRAQLLKDVVRLWPSLNAKNLGATFPGWLQAMMLLVRSYHGQSAQAAAEFYRLARTESIRTPLPSGLIHIAPDPVEEWLASAFGYSGPGMMSRDTAQPGTALSTTLGTAARIALDGGRRTILDTVANDPAAVGWYRVTDGHPCAFCALLASRGVVYKERTADFKSHNDCGCTSAPAFSRAQPMPTVNDRAAEVYRQHAQGQSDPLAAFRRAWAAHSTP